GALAGSVSAFSINCNRCSRPSCRRLVGRAASITVEAMQRGHKDRLASLLSGVTMAVLLGSLLGLPFWLLGLFRIIRVSGYWRAVHYMRRGRVLIVANHPSLIETFLIPLVFWPWAMVRLRMFVWSLPDKNLFKGFTPHHH